MGWINTDWETYLTAIYQTDSQTIKCIQHPFFKFKKQFLNFYKEPLLLWSLTSYHSHNNSRDTRGSIQKWDAPKRKRQQQNNMLRKDSEEQYKENRQKYHHKIVPEWHRLVTCFTFLFPSLLFGLVRKRTILGVWSSGGKKVSFKSRNLS